MYWYKGLNVVYFCFHTCVFADFLYFHQGHAIAHRHWVRAFDPMELELTGNSELSNLSAKIRSEQ